MRIREPLSSALIGDRPKTGHTDPRDLDAEMIARVPVATAEDHHNLFIASDGLFMTIDGVVGGMQDADAPLLAGSVGGIRRGWPRPYGQDQSR